MKSSVEQVHAAQCAFGSDMSLESPNPKPILRCNCAPEMECIFRNCAQAAASGSSAGGGRDALLKPFFCDETQLRVMLVRGSAHTHASSARKEEEEEELQEECVLGEQFTIIRP